MKNLNIYINFGGRAQEALSFYKECLGGEITSMRTYADGPMEVPEEQKNRVMHAEFKSEGIFMMVSDGNPNMPLVHGNQTNLSLNLDNLEEGKKIFANLSEGGKVMMPFSKQFWGAQFGMFVDKFGVNWMVNCNVEAKDGKQYV